LAAVGFTVAFLTSVCSDSNHNQTATPSKRRSQNRRQNDAWLIDDECSIYSIIYLFENNNPKLMQKTQTQKGKNKFILILGW